MALVTYKYMVERMPVEELRRTFAARQHTLDYLVGEMRAQTRSKTLKSFFLYGPRGAGKTTLVRMLALNLEEDPELRAAWLPVVFPEELRGVTSLRELLAAMLRVLGENGIPAAREWHARVEDERDDAASRDHAIQGLRQIVRDTGRRLAVFVENLDALFADRRAHGLDGQERATLRRLLMAPDPWMLLVGTGVVSFPAIERYDEALFQYFQPVPLDRLDDEQVRQLLFARAAFDKLDGFAERYRVNQDRIRALTRLTGGNPRLAMMLYETITTGSLPTIVQQLQGLVDSLTPLLKDVLDHQMTPQQAKVMDALMRAGGTAQPRDLVASTRLTLNAVNTQLTRLKEMQLLDVLGGGKGRPAYYTVPDRLFSTWYQLRYLRPNRRRIEIFVEFLRVWFEEDARCEYLKCQQGDTAGEIADLRAAAAQAGASEEVRAVVTAGVLKRVVRGTALDEAVVFARQVSTHFPAAAIPRFIIAVLRRSADAGMRPHWPRICRALCENQPPEVAEKLAFLLPVCEVLETNDRSRLDPLPPEQRDFALEVLRGFEVAS